MAIRSTPRKGEGPRGQESAGGAKGTRMAVSDKGMVQRGWGIVPRISAECMGMAGGDKGTVPRGQCVMAMGSAKGTWTAVCTKQS